MCDEIYEIEEGPGDINADNFYKKLPEELLQKMERLITGFQHFIELGDDISLREYKELQELDSELEFISLEIDSQEENLQLCENCVKITFHFGGFLKGKNIQDQKIYFHTCEGDPIVWKYNVESEIFECLSTNLTYHDKYGLGTGDLKTFSRIMDFSITIKEKECIY